MDWFRWHHGTATDAKWRLVARRTGQPLTAVLATWALMLEHASENEDRGSLAGWDDEVAAAALDLEPESVSAIRQAMQGLTLDGDHLPSWSKRQPKREDNSTSRVRAHRERVKRSETQSNAPEESRGEENREESTSILKLHAGEPLEEEASNIIRLANRGMADNPAVGDVCNPIPISHGSRQTVLDWLRDGIPADVAGSVVYERAKEYQPDGRRRQITTMRYFDGAVRDEHDRQTAKGTPAPKRQNGKRPKDAGDYGEGTTEYRGLNG